MAARFMDAAAHGGMVVCEESLLEQAFDMWQASRLSASARHAVDGCAVCLLACCVLFQCVQMS